MLTPWPILQFQYGMHQAFLNNMNHLTELGNAMGTDHRVHPFRHPQFLNIVGITPDEISDDLDLMPRASTSRPTTSSPPSEYHEQYSFLGGIKEKIRASKQARAAAHANIIRKRFRTKQLFHIEARKAIIASRISRGDWNYGEIELIPPRSTEYGGPGYLEGNFATAFVRKTFRAFCRGDYPNTLPSSPSACRQF